MSKALANRLQDVDPEIAAAIAAECDRQNQTLEMIASENFVSRAVMDAAGGVMTNKYAEGYPAKRYYGGCTNVDVAESLARDRAKQLFKCGHVNVQPHSGSQANMAAYFALAPAGSTILGMDLAHGGHLTHGSSVNFSGKLFRVVSYGVQRDTGEVNYDEIRTIAEKEKPQIILAGFSAYPRKLDFAQFADIARSVGAFLVTDMAHVAGLVATGHYPDPLPHSDLVTTTTHKTLRGPRGGMILMNEESAKRKIPDPWSGKERMIKNLVDSRVFPGSQGGPLMHIIAAKAVAFQEALQDSFQDYSAQVIANAQALGGALMEKGYNLVTGGTDNHLILVDLRNKGVTGKDAEEALEAAGITVNKNMVPFDDQSPFVTSGVRIGTPALTTRGLQEADFQQIAALIDRVLQQREDSAAIASVRTEVTDLAARYPLYTDV